MTQLRKPLTAGAVDEYLNHIKDRLTAGDDAAALLTSLRAFDSAVAGDVVKSRLNQVIETLKKTRSLTNGVVTAVITNAGTGYSVGDVIPIVGDIGEVASIAVNTAGTGYSPGDAITIIGDGTGATAEVATVGGSGEITGITVTDGGTGYTYASANADAVGNGDAVLTPTVNPVTGVGGSITVEAVGGSGEITSVFVSAGQGYVSTSAADSSGVGGEDATFDVTISNELATVESVASSIASA